MFREDGNKVLIVVPSRAEAQTKFRTWHIVVGRCHGLAVHVELIRLLGHGRQKIDLLFVGIDDGVAVGTT